MKSDPSPQVSKSKSKTFPLRMLLAFLLIGMLFLVGGFFIFTSSWFATNVILPRLGTAIHSKLEASKVSGRIGTSIEIQDLNLTSYEESKILSIDHLAFSYHLKRILGGEIVASNLILRGLDLDLIVKSDGTLNVSPILKTFGKSSQKSSSSRRIDLTDLKIENGRIRVNVENQNGQGSIYEIRDLNLSIDRLAGESDCQLTLTGQLIMRQNKGEMTNSVSAHLDQSMHFSLDRSLFPVSFEAALKLLIEEAKGNFSNFVNHQIDLKTKMSDGHLAEFQIDLSHSNQSMGQMNLSGPLDLKKGIADLAFSVEGIDENLLNPFSKLLGFELGMPQLKARGRLSFFGKGQPIALDLKIFGEQIILQNILQKHAFQNENDAFQNASSPDLAFELALSAMMNRGESSLHLHTFSFHAHQSDRPIFSFFTQDAFSIRGKFNEWRLENPILIQAEIANLELADWRMIFGETAAGKIHSNLTIQSAGDRLESIGLAGDLDVSRGEEWGVRAEFSANIQDKNAIDFSKLNFSVRTSKGEFLKGKADMHYAKTGLMHWVSDLSVRIPGEPEAMSLGISIDAKGRRNTRRILDSLSLKLPSTTNAPQNELRISGEWLPADLSGKIHIASKSLDLNPLIDFVDRLPKHPKKSGESIQKTEAFELPLNHLNATLQLDKLFIREMILDNWLSEILLEKRAIRIEPLTLDLNGTPIRARARLDFSPRYAYEIALKSTGLAAEPFIRSIVPSFKKASDAKIDLALDMSGEGFRAADFKSNLKGTADISFRGVQIELFNSWKKFFLSPIAVVLRLPALLESPLQRLDIHSSVQKGIVDLARFKVSSPHFQLITAGSIPLADDLSASPLALPVDFTLKKEMATRANLASSGAKASEGFVSLSPFASIEGSLGEPTIKIDKLAIGKLFIRNVAALPETVVGEAGEVLQGLGTWVGDKKGNIKDSVKDAGNAIGNLFKRKSKKEDRKKD